MIKIIPAIDIIDGRCVRLTKGDYNTKTDYGITPLEMAKKYEEIGVKYLHLVDLDGAKASKPINLKCVEDVCKNSNMIVEFGGGIKSNESIEKIFEIGVSSAICGSVAITNPQIFIEWLQRWGGKRVVLGADINNGKIAINGWLESKEITIDNVIDMFKPYGLEKVICTDISKDGTLKGPNFELYKNLQTKYPDIKFTVSGGISSMDDLKELNRMNLDSVIIGKAIYEGHITLNSLKEWLQNE